MSPSRRHIEYKKTNTETPGLMINYKLADIASLGSATLQFGPDVHSQLAKSAISHFFNPLLDTSLSHDTLFQIVELRDVTHSNISLIESYLELKDINLKYVDRQKSSNSNSNSNNGTNKRQKIIRHVDQDSTNHTNKITPNPQDQQFEEGTDLSNNSKSLFKITLQDSKGNYCYAMENPQSKLPFLRIHFKPNVHQIWPIKLGSKVIIKASSKLVNSVFLLSSKDVVYLGGEVAQWNINILDKALIKLNNDLNENNQ